MVGIRTVNVRPGLDIRGLKTSVTIRFLVYSETRGCVSKEYHGVYYLNDILDLLSKKNLRCKLWLERCESWCCAPQVRSRPSADCIMDEFNQFFLFESDNYLVVPNPEISYGSISENPSYSANPFHSPKVRSSLYTTTSTSTAPPWPLPKTLCRAWTAFHGSCQTV